MGDHARVTTMSWEQTPMHKFLKQACKPTKVQNAIQDLFFRQGTDDADAIVDNSAKWSSLSDTFAKTVARHYSNTPLMGALAMRGLTPNVYENTAKVMLRVPGVHVMYPILSGAVGDHVRRVRLDGISAWIRHEKRVIIVGDSSLNLGKGKTPHEDFKKGSQ